MTRHGGTRQVAGAGMGALFGPSARMGLRALAGLLALVVGLSGTGGPVAAQNLFAPVAIVGNGAVTYYERSQRIAFLTLLGAPGDRRALAMDQLINERLQMDEARRMGVSVTPEEIAQGMAEFAARGNLDAEQMLTLLAQGGISAETFRDFVESGLTWRKVVQQKFLPQAQITQAEIDAAYAQAEPTTGLKLLLTEILLPASSPESLKASRARADRLTKIDTAEEFGNAAKRFSVAASRLAKGERDWVDIQALPPQSQAALRNVRAGQTSRPVVIPDVGVVVYFVRERETIRSTKVGELLDYAAFLIPAGSNADARAVDLRAKVVVCDDLYPIARSASPDQLTREELPPSAVPSAYRAELATMDPGEISTRLTSAGGARVFLMLCNRRNDVPASVSRTQIAEALVNRRIEAMATDYLAGLRADTHIEYP